MENWSSFVFNSKLIKRTSDLCLFDPDNFKLFQLNESAFAIVDKIENGRATELDFKDSDVSEFINQCINNQILLPKT